MYESLYFTLNFFIFIYNFFLPFNEIFITDKHKSLFTKTAILSYCNSNWKPEDKHKTDYAQYAALRGRHSW